MEGFWIVLAIFAIVIRIIISVSKAQKKGGAVLQKTPSPAVKVNTPPLSQPGITICPQCGSKVPPQSLTCPSCLKVVNRQTLSEASLQCSTDSQHQTHTGPQAFQPPEEERSKLNSPATRRIRTCPDCGQEVKLLAMKCKACGAHL